MGVVGPGMVVVDRLWVFLLYSLLPPMCCNKAENLKVPLLQLTHNELMSKNNSAMFNDAGRGAAYQALLLNEDHGWLLIGGRDHIYMLNTDNFTQPANKIYWPADQEHIERCKFAGKNLLMDCANYVRLLQPFNKTHVYVCGTGAFYPQCTYIELGLNLEKPTFWLLDNVRDSGKGKCPFSPKEPFTARLTDGNLYAGISVDFMGTNPAICRTSLHGGSQHYIRSEGYQDQWLNEPEFVGSFSIHDTHSLDDDKVYFFFKETAVESNQLDKRIFSRVARVCKNDIGGKRSLINRWSTFLKARLVCSHPGPEGMDTHFDELQDIFLLETKDPQNPVIYGLFSTSSSVFRGSAICVYSMASIRAAFNGPFAHKEGSDYRWTEYKGRIPYPRPGTCPSETYDPLHKSTHDFPDEVVSFMRTHQLMWEPVMPINRRPIYTMIDSPYSLNKLVVDRVHREHGQYDVLHLGTDDGKVLKVVSVYRDGVKTEEIFLEELQVFKARTPILSMELSTKRQVLFVSSDAGVVRLPLQRCALYGTLCVDCWLSRDPYCAWDGTSCTKHFPTSKRLSRRQDVRYREPWRQCEDLRDSQRAELKTVYGLEGSSTFLDCSPPSPQAKITWTIQSHQNIKNKVFSEDERVIHMGRGLLLRHITPASAGLYQCDAHDFSFTRTVAYYQLHVIPQHRISEAQDGPRENSTTLAQSRREEHHQRVNRKKADEYCRQLWYHRQHGLQKVQMLKWKHVLENRKGRVRRHDANPESSDAWLI